MSVIAERTADEVGSAVVRVHEAPCDRCHGRLGGSVRRDFNGPVVTSPAARRPDLAASFHTPTVLCWLPEVLVIGETTEVVLDERTGLAQGAAADVTSLREVADETGGGSVTG